MILLVFKGNAKAEDLKLYVVLKKININTHFWKIIIIGNQNLKRK